jgi:PAB1-binding protein PBP1
MGLLRNLLGAAQVASMFIPGMQAFTPYLTAANALANGNPAGAAGAVAGGVVNSAMNAQPAASNAANGDSLLESIIGTSNGTRPETRWDKFLEDLNKTEHQRKWGL